MGVDLSPAELTGYQRADHVHLIGRVSGLRTVSSLVISRPPSAPAGLQAANASASTCSRQLAPGRTSGLPTKRTHSFAAHRYVSGLRSRWDASALSGHEDLHRSAVRLLRSSGAVH